MVEQLKERIRASRQNLKQLGLAAGVAPSQLSRFMRGERTLTLPAAERLCRTLGLRLTTDPAGPAPSGEKAAPKRGRGIK